MPDRRLRLALACLTEAERLSRRPHQFEEGLSLNARALYLDAARASVGRARAALEARPPPVLT